MTYPEGQQPPYQPQPQQPPKLSVSPAAPWFIVAVIIATPILLCFGACWVEFMGAALFS